MPILLVALRNYFRNYIYDLGHRDHVSERVVEVLGLSLPIQVRYLRLIHRVFLSNLFGGTYPWSVIQITISGMYATPDCPEVEFICGYGPTTMEFNAHCPKTTISTQGRAYRVVQVVQDTTALKLAGGTCNVQTRKLNLVLKSRILRKDYLNLFSIKYQYKSGSPNRRERSPGILMGQIVPL